MAGDQLHQESAGLQSVAATTDTAVQAVNNARTNMQVFLDEFASRSRGSFVEATHAASLRISDLFKKIEDRLTKYAGDSRALDADIQAANQAQAAKMGGVAGGASPLV